MTTTNSESIPVPRSEELTPEQGEARRKLKWLGSKKKKVIAIGGLKGGVGKSTMSIFIALVYARHYGLRVLLVDADPMSQTAYDWYRLAKKKGDPLPYAIETWPHARVGDRVLEDTDGYDVVVIDCGGESSDIFGSAVAVCDQVLFVTSPRKAEMRRIRGSLDGALSAAREAGRLREIAADVVFTRVKNSRASHNEAAREKIRAANYDLLAAEVPDLVDYEDAMETCPKDLGHFLKVVETLEAAA
ncbi:ParA family protein [Actinacidiphila yeochonensis]|uniref:ParA family protein n=1 Tax=Actinacidiphila yeochonensis TaxID=89050 RepID=UPI0005610A8D|nr:ParA family protein [Actinacidiphila yeochonensis]